jgi:hypothetical protein
MAHWQAHFCIIAMILQWLFAMPGCHATCQDAPGQAAIVFVLALGAWQNGCVSHV